MDLSFNNFLIINTNNFFILILKLVLDLIVMHILFNKIYIKFKNNRNFLFMIGIFNIMIFLVCSLLSNLTLSLGFSFGIFAIFSILRYRTINIPTKEMTYLFIAISVALINSLYSNVIGLVELLFTHTIIILITYIIEKTWMKNIEFSKFIIYERIELIKPKNSKLLLEDLKTRTGLNIHRYEIGRINFLKDIVQIKVYFYDDKDHFNTDNFDDDDDD